MKTQFASYRVRRVPISLDVLNDIADGEMVSINVAGDWLMLQVAFDSDLSSEDIAAAKASMEDRAHLRDVILEPFK